MRCFIIMESLTKYYPTIQRFLSLRIALCMSDLHWGNPTPLLLFMLWVKARPLNGLHHPSSVVFFIEISMNILILWFNIIIGADVWHCFLLLILLQNSCHSFVCGKVLSHKCITLLQCLSKQLNYDIELLSASVYRRNSAFIMCLW